MGDTWFNETCDLMTCEGPHDVRKIDMGCAEDAQCGRDVKGEYICLCNDGFNGDPYGEACVGKTSEFFKLCLHFSVHLVMSNFIRMRINFSTGSS